MNADTNTLFPIFLKLDQQHTLLVGGGNVGLEKLSAMLGNAPLSKITVVAPLIREELKEYAKDFPQVELIERPYQHSDLQNKSIVVCATDNPVLHTVIKAMANTKGLLVNVADTPPLCDFYLGSIVQKGNLKIAISTNGKSPTVAKRLKQVLNEGISDNINELLDSINKLRDSLKGDFNEKVRILNEHTQNLIK
jgi:precorrin-2 dehydrogenase / sirohydrochlorin ferrochelatase